MFSLHETKVKIFSVGLHINLEQMFYPSFVCYNKHLENKWVPRVIVFKRQSAEDPIEQFSLLW